MFASKLTGRGASRVFGFVSLLGLACADGDETQTYTYTGDPTNVTVPPGTTVTVSPNQPDLAEPGDGPAQESLEPEDLSDLDAVGGAGGFAGTSGLGGSGGVGGGVPLGGASGIDVSGDDDADGLGGGGFGGTGTAGTTGGSF
jgi:hypothetical protein